MSIIECFDQTGQMSSSRYQNQNVEDLMRIPPNIEASRRPPLWYSCSVDRRADNVNDAMRNEPGQSNCLVQIINTKSPDPLRDWEYSGKTHGYEHGGPDRSPLRGSEFWRCSYSSCSHSDGRDHSPIRLDHSYIVMEAVIDARNEAAPDQEHYTEIVELVAPSYNFGRMIGDGVVGGAHA